MNYLILFCTWWAQSVRVSQMFLLLFWGGAFTDLGSLLPCMPSTTFSWVFERDPLCISKVLSLWGSVNSNILTYCPQTLGCLGLSPDSAPSPWLRKLTSLFLSLYAAHDSKPRDPLQVVKWCICGDHLICFLSLKNHYLSLFEVQWFKNDRFIDSVWVF